MACPGLLGEASGPRNLGHSPYYSRGSRSPLLTLFTELRGSTEFSEARMRDAARIRSERLGYMHHEVVSGEDGPQAVVPMDKYTARCIDAALRLGSTPKIHNDLRSTLELCSPGTVLSNRSPFVFNRGKPPLELKGIPSGLP